MTYSLPPQLRRAGSKPREPRQPRLQDADADAPQDIEQAAPESYRGRHRAPVTSHRAATDAAPTGRRRAATAAAMGVLAAILAPGLATAPASANPTPAPTTSQCAGLGAAAAGDVVTLRLLDLRPLGVRLAPVADVRLASTRAGLTASAGRSAALARYVEGSVLGLGVPTGPLGASAYQIAPPNQPPVVVKPAGLDLGAVKVGAGDLRARAAYRDSGGCDTNAGADASAALLDASVLPGPRALVRARDNLSTTAHTALVQHEGRTAAAATSTASVVDLSLLGAVKVKVLSRPTLRAVAAGSKDKSRVDYTNPIFGIDLPGGRSVKLDRAGESVDVQVPTDEAGAAAPGLLPLPGVGNLVPDLTGLIGGVAGAVQGAAPGAAPEAGATGSAETGAAQLDTGIDVSPGAGAPTAPSIPGLDALSGVPALGGLLGGVGGISGLPIGKTALVLRLTAGEISKEITDTGVHAKAISLRLKLLLCTGDQVSTVVDLAIGVLEVAATAPIRKPHDGGGYGPPGGGGAAGTETPSASPSGTGVGVTGVPTTPPAGGKSEAGGKLPVTGSSMPVVLGSGVLLLSAGRLLMVLARRRLIS